MLEPFPLCEKMQWRNQFMGKTAHLNMITNIGMECRQTPNGTVQFLAFYMTRKNNCTDIKVINYCKIIRKKFE